MMISCLVMMVTLHRSGFDERSVHIGTAVAEELPGLADFGNQVEVEVGGEDFVLIAAGLREDSAARVAEIALAVKFADVPRGLGAHAVDGADEVPIGHGVR